MKTKHGFTLIELLVVAALVVVLVGGSAVALRRSESTSLQTGEQLVVSLVTQAQSVARAGQAETRLVIHAALSGSEASEQFLRAAQILRKTPEGSWTAVGPVVCLPRGVAIVPPKEVALSSVPAAVNRSKLAIVTGADGPEGFHDADTVMYLAFEADGALAGATGYDAKIVLAAFTGGTLNPRFNSTDAARSIRVGRRGVITIER